MTDVLALFYSRFPTYLLSCRAFVDHCHYQLSFLDSYIGAYYKEVIYILTLYNLPTTFKGACAQVVVCTAEPQLRLSRPTSGALYSNLPGDSADIINTLGGVSGYWSRRPSR